MDRLQRGLQLTARLLPCEAANVRLSARRELEAESIVARQIDEMLRQFPEVPG